MDEADVARLDGELDGPASWGSAGTAATAEWTLVEMTMDAPVVASLEREFKLYHIP